MPNYRVSVANGSSTALPKDLFVNTLYFQRDTAFTDSEWATFLTAINGAFASVAGMAYPSRHIKAYNMADATPRPVLASRDATGLDGTAGPTEVALCLSYFSGRNLPSSRGRIYIGPWDVSVILGPHPAGGVITSLINLGVALDTAASVSSCVWVVHSVKDNDYLPITNLWVDNAWDTQRRRGLASTSRTTRVL